MAAEAGWKADPSGAHELRYWDGTAWTEHVSNAGVQSSDPVTQTPPPPPPPSTPPSGGGGGGWRDRLAQVAQQGKELAEKGRAELAKQQANREQAIANDPNTLWYGERKSIGSNVVGVSSVRYRVTRDRIYIESGVLGASSEQVPLWAVRDIDVRQSALQRGKDIGDVVVWLEHPEFHGQAEVLLDNIERPHELRDLLNSAVSEARSKKLMQSQTQFVHYSGIPPFGAQPPQTQPHTAAAPSAAAEPVADLAEQLQKLAALRDQGILTEEEFAAQKAKLLDT